MGCSPSKGKLFSKPGITEAPNARPSEAPKEEVDPRPSEEEGVLYSVTAEKENEPPTPTEEQPEKEATNSPLASITRDVQIAENIQETEVNVSSTAIDDEVEQAAKMKMEKRKKNKIKRRSERKKSFTVQAKVDFPPHMVRAHQAAYAFLNPNISKYETLLGLLDQAAQTQLSLQPMMSALVLRFEEINQALEEMAEEGELMLKEHGDYMALPSGMLGPAVMQAKLRTTAASPPEPPPDLLQQLLQHSTEKMRLVGGSVQALGDTTLEEAVDYFSSLSKLLFGKLQAKQASQQRLTQILAKVEEAAMRKLNLEDTALHSEDSGIGGENESLTGSERHRHHRGSAGSGSCGSGNNIRCASDTPPGNLANLEGEDEGEEEEDDDEEYEDDDSDGPERKRSNSSPPDPSQALLYLRAKYMQEWQSSSKRPLTAAAAKVENSSSSKCLNIMMELQRSKRDLDQQMTKMAHFRSYKESARPPHHLHTPGLRRHSSSGSAGALKGSLTANQSQCSLPLLGPQPPKRPSVRRLINTFSKGVDGRPGQSLDNIPPHIRRARRTEILLLSDTFNVNEGGSGISGNNSNHGWAYGKDDLDVDSLPPPPPEVLMDDSFQSTEAMPGNAERMQANSARSLPVIHQNSGVSQRLKASVQNVEVLPNRASVRPGPVTILPARTVRQDAVGPQDAEKHLESDLDPDLEKANVLYQQARKIIHLRNASESLVKKNLAELSRGDPSTLQARLGQMYDSSDFYDGEMASCSPPVTAPPVSRVRLPPSCPSVCHRFPSPPANRPQTASRSLSRPGSPRTVTRATDKTPEEIVPSVSFHDARSVFCLKEPQNTPSPPGSSVLPRPWGDAPRGRLPSRGTDNTRRTQSEQRPGVGSSSEFSKDCGASRCAKEE